jgi:transposase-like protein
VQLDLQNLIDDAKCFQAVRQMRWPQGVRCPHCESVTIIRQGRDETQPERQRYRCETCSRKFDDLTGTVFAGHHQPLSVWILCLYLMGLNLSNRQIAQELGLNKDDVHQMASCLRAGVIERQPTPELSGEVECDEVYVVAGHKGHPEAVRKKGVPDDAAD